MPKSKGKYVDGFVLVVPKNKIQAYKKVASQAGKIWKEYGALDYKECVGEELTIKNSTMKIKTFTELARPKPNETVVFSWIVYKSKAHRNAVNTKIMKDERMNEMGEMPFDMKKMAYGGFEILVDF